MSDAGLRQKAVAAWGGMVLLYALLVAFWFLVQQDSWAAARRRFEKARATYNEQRALVDRRKAIQAEHEEVRSSTTRLTSHAGTDFIDILEELSKKDRLRFEDMKTEKSEEVEGSPIRVKRIYVGKWIGSLDCLRDLLVDLSYPESGMYHVKQITVRPNTRQPGYLDGSLTVDCAYMEN